MYKITSLKQISQVESRKKNKKRRIPRVNDKSSFKEYLLITCRPEKISHKKGFEFRHFFDSLTPRNKRAAQILFREIQKSGNNLTDKSLQYFADSVGFESVKTISRLFISLEKMGLIKVYQFMKEVNHYCFGPEIRSSIVINYLVKHLPSLRYLLAPLFAATLLLSQSQPQQHIVRPPKEKNFNNPKESFKNKSMEEKVNTTFGKEYLEGPSFRERSSPPTPQKVYYAPFPVKKLCCLWREADEKGRRTLCAKNAISFTYDRHNKITPIGESGKKRVSCTEACLKGKGDVL